MVEVDEETPVEPPGALLQCEERSSGPGSTALVDVLAEERELLDGGVPGTLEDVRGELTPHGGEEEVRVGREDTEVVEVVGRAGVVSDRVLELSEAVQERDLVECDLGDADAWSVAGTGDGGRGRERKVGNALRSCP